MVITRELNMGPCLQPVAMDLIYRLHSNINFKLLNVMKIIQKTITGRMQILLISCCSILLATCTKNYSEMNRDRNTIATVGSAELPFLFSKAEESSIPNIWNYQVAQNLFA